MSASNNSTGQPHWQPQITPVGNDSSNRSSRTSNDTPSSRSSLQLETALHEDLLANQGRAGGQAHFRGTYGHPIPLLPLYTNFWNGASLFPEHVPGNAAGNSSRGDGYHPSVPPAYGGQPMQTGQTGGEHRGMYYGGYQPSAATANPLPAGGYPTYPPHPSSGVQGDSTPVWQSVCWIDRAERDEVRMTIVLRRTPPA